MKKICILILVAVLSAGMAGCGKKNVQNDENAYTGTLVFTYGDNYVTKGEVYIYLNTIAERYEKQYGENVWENTLPSDDAEGEVSMEEAVKEEAVNEIVRVKTLYDQAEKYKVYLTEADEAALSEQAKIFYDGLTDADISKMEIDEETVYKVLLETETARRVEEKLLEDNPVEISDEEARMTTFYDMYFPCYTIDENGVITPYTEEEKKIQYENALSACSTLATANIDEDKDAENIANLAEYYKLVEAGEYTISPQEILDTYGQDVYDMLYSMKSGDYSGVMETEYGYHVFQMIALTDPKATQAKKETMTEAAVTAQLSDNLSSWRKKTDPDFSYPESVDMDVYDTIIIN